MKLKIFFLSFLISLPFWWAVNGLEKKFEGYWIDLSMANNYKSLTAQADSFFVNSRDAKNVKIKTNPPSITAEAGLVVRISENGKKEVLFSKNANESLPIASLSKLMTADVVMENYNNTSQAVIISEEIAQDAGNDPVLKSGEELSLQSLLYSMLLESNNEAAEAISSLIGRDALVDLMNLEAKNLGLINTVFYNPSGRDPREGEEDVSKINISTANDLLKLAEHIISKPLIIEILQTRKMPIFSMNGDLHHTSVTTNKFLLDGDTLNGGKIIAGKTGETNRAGQCFLVVLEDSKTKNKLISVVLHSSNRFDDTKELLDWATEAYN